MGLPPSPRPADYRSIEHHIIGNRMRLADESRLRLDERWRSDLAASDRQVIERIVGPLNASYGYAA